MEQKVKETIALLLCAVMVFAMLPTLAVSASESNFIEIAEQWQIPEKTKLEAEGPQHMQGFAVDLENSHMYWSFTTSLVKTDLEGTKIKEISLPSGHLGDLAFYDGYIYGSYLSGNWDQWDGMYVCKYDTELNLIAQYEFEQLNAWVDAFLNGDKDANPYNVASIDGVAVGEDPNGEVKLMLAAGIGPADNQEPYQLIMQCTLDGEYETYYAMETGALPYGCQNLTYNWDTGNYWLGCYRGEFEGQVAECMFEVDIRKGYDERVINRWQYNHRWVYSRGS